jgi:hypothetical protein
MEVGKGPNWGCSAKEKNRDIPTSCLTKTELKKITHFLCQNSVHESII